MKIPLTTILINLAKQNEIVFDTLQTDENDHCFYDADGKDLAIKFSVKEIEEMEQLILAEQEKNKQQQLNDINRRIEILTKLGLTKAEAQLLLS